MKGRPQARSSAWPGCAREPHQTISRTCSAWWKTRQLRSASRRKCRRAALRMVMGFPRASGPCRATADAAAGRCPTAEVRKLAAYPTAPSGRHRTEVLHSGCARLEDRWQAAAPAPLSRPGLARRSQVSAAVAGADPGFEEGARRIRQRCRADRCRRARTRDLLLAETGIATSLPKRPSMAARADYTDAPAATWPFSERWWMRSSRRSSNLSSVPIGCHPRGPFGMSRMQPLMPVETLNLYLLNELLDLVPRWTSDFRNLNSGGVPWPCRMEPWLARVSHWVQALPAYAWYEIVDLPGDQPKLRPGARGTSSRWPSLERRSDCGEHRGRHAFEHAAIARGILAARMASRRKSTPSSRHSRDAAKAQTQAARKRYA